MLPLVLLLRSKRGLFLVLEVFNLSFLSLSLLPRRVHSRWSLEHTTSAFMPKKPYSLGLGVGFGLVLSVILFVMVTLVILCVWYIHTHITLPLPPGATAGTELQPAGVDPALRQNMSQFDYN